MKSKLNIFHDLNSTESAIDTSLNIPTLQVAAAKENPYGTAVKFKDNKLSNAEFDAISNRIANFLLAKGFEKGTCIGLYTERCIELTPTIFGILKAGLIYVPISTEFPQSRIEYIIDNCKIKMILYGEGTNPKKINRDVNFFSIVNFDVFKLFPSTTPAVHLKNEDSCYVIYTSGTTGNPKGVEISHGAILNRLLWMKSHYNLTKKDIFLQKTPMSFDVSIWELFLPHACGSQLVIAPPDSHKNPKELNQLIKNNKVSIVHFIPSMLNIYLECPGLIKCPSLNKVFCSGEVLSYSLKEKFFKLVSGTELHNLYGPTEAAIDVTYFDCSNNYPHRKLPIGRPVWNTKLYILNKEGKLCAYGEEGELYITGENLAKGYINNPSLTTEKFLEIEIEDSPIRAYRTGDLCSLSNHNEIEYHGRIDNQVKINGVRIELEEIERTAEEYDSTITAVAMVNQLNNHDQQLLLALNSKKPVILDKFENFLKSKLPNYMIPHLIFMIDRVPLTLNGKADRKRIADEYFSSLNHLYKNDNSSSYTDIFCSVLGRESIDSKKSFLQNGGHSLLCIKLTNLIQQKFQKKISVKDIYLSKTLEDLSVKINDLPSEPTTPSIDDAISNVTSNKIFDVQESYWFAMQKFSDEVAYYINFDILFSGDYDLEKFKQALLFTFSIDPVFNSIFLIKNGTLSTEYRDFPILIEESLANTKDFFTQKIDIEKGPLYHLALQKKDHGIKLYIQIHHLIFDGISIDLLIDAILKKYHDRAHDIQNQKFDDFKKVYQRDKSGLAKNNLRKWTKELLAKNYCDIFEPSELTTHDFGVAEITISSSEELESIKAFAADESLTIPQFFLWAYANSVNRYLGNDQPFYIGLPISIRDYFNFNNCIGPLINTLPLYCNPIKGTIPQSLIKEEMLKALSYSVVPINDLLKSVRHKISNQLYPFYQVCFSYMEYKSNSSEWSNDTKISSYYYSSKFPLTFYVNNNPNNIKLTFEYQKSHLSDSIANKMLQHIMTITDLKTSKVSDQSKSFIRTTKVVPSDNNHSKLSATNKAKVVSILKDLTGLSEIDMSLPFNKLGLHSLLTIKFMYRLNTELNFNINLKSIITAPSVDSLFEKNLSSNKEKQAPHTIDSYEMHPYQRKFFYFDKLEGTYENSLITGALTFEETLNRDFLEKLLQNIIDTHLVLHTRFPSLSTETSLKLKRPFLNECLSFNVDTKSSSKNVEWYNQILDKFSLKNYLFHFYVTEDTQNHNFTLFYKFHHAIIDEGSLFNILEKIQNRYEGKITTTFQDQDSQFIEYCNSLKSNLSTKTEQCLNFWKNKKISPIHNIYFPYDKECSLISGQYEQYIQTITLSNKTSKNIRKFCSNNNFSENSFFLSLFIRFIHEFSNEEIITVFSTVSTREFLGFENSIGLYLNDLIIQHKFDDNETLLETVTSVYQFLQEAQPFIDFPFDLLKEKFHESLSLPQDVQFLYNFHIVQEAPEGHIDIPLKKTKAHFKLSIVQKEENFELIFQVAQNLFHQKTIMYLIDQYIQKIKTSLAPHV